MGVVRAAGAGLELERHVVRDARRGRAGRGVAGLHALRALRALVVVPLLAFATRVGTVLPVVAMVLVQRWRWLRWLVVPE